MPCWGCLLAFAQRAKKVIPSQHGDTFSCRTEGGFLLVFYLVIHTKGHLVTPFHSEVTERAKWLLTSSFHRNPTPQTHSWWHLFPSLIPSHYKGNFSISRRWISLRTSCSLGNWAAPGKREQKDEKSQFQSFKSLQSTLFIKSNFCQGRGTYDKNVVTQQYE